MRRLRSSPFFLLASITTAGALAVVAVACGGSDGAPGAAGQTGATGSQGTPGTQGPAGDPGATGMLPDGGLSAGCLSPCHGFNGVVAQYQTSVHYATYVNNLNGGEVASWTGATACGNCHAIDGLEQRVAGNVVFTGDAGVANLANGEIEYKSSINGKVAECTYGGQAKVAAVYCTSCHKVTDANDPHKTGKPWTPGSFAFQVPVGASDTAFIEKSPVVGAITGQSAGTLEESNTCVWCHRSRKDVTNYITGPGNNLGSAYWGPHEGPQTDVYSGKGGYHFGTNTYGTSTHQLELTCTNCHMPPVADNQNVPNHSFYPQLSVCQNCHAGATSFDVNGGESTIRAALFAVQAALNTDGYLSRATAAPYTPLAGSQLTDGAFDLDQANGNATGLTADQAGALYDYILVARGGAFGVHNPKYAQELLYDSFVAASPPATPVPFVRP
ncbi:MAG: hypothetical protein ACRELY_07435 [Polyangiaceae bacterium]